MAEEEQQAQDGEGTTYGEAEEGQGDGSQQAEGAGSAREGGGGRRSTGTRRRLSYRELEDVVVRACVVPVGGVPSADQARWGEGLTTASTREYISIARVCNVRRCCHILT